jgi:thioredoxin reductase (NADPH)
VSAQAAGEEGGPLLTVYSRAWCHLCDDLLAELEALRREFAFRVEVIDVDAHPEHEARHGERVPVLMAEERELCHYFLDTAAVRAYLSSFR